MDTRIALILLSLFFFCCGSSLAQPAEMILKNGAIYTVDGSRSWARCLAVREGHIVYLGQGEPPADFVGPSTEIVDLGGKMVLPGFHDSHVHPASGGVELLQCDLNSLKSPASVEAEIRRYASEHPDLTWIVGGGWQLSIFPGGQPSRQMLDRLVPDRPAFFTSSDAHTAWVNTAALAAAGIDSETADPPGGKIERDAGGEPSGLVREEAIGMITPLLPPISPENYREGLLKGLQIANSHGITSLTEANADKSILDAYLSLERENLLSARVVAALSTDPKRGPEQVDDLVRIRARARGGELFRPESAKLFADGVIEGHTAALLSPYLDEPHSGFLIWPEQAYQDTIVALDAAGFQIHVHAIGDRAIRFTLDGLERARKENGPRDARHQIAHLQLPDPRDIKRFRELDVIANFQADWAFNDDFMVNLTIPVLGPERSRWLYPIRAFYDQGVVVVGGSDWSVTTMNPLEAIQVAITRTDPDNPEATPLTPEERMDLPAMLAAYTINGAYGMHQEANTGSLEVGKWADFVILDHNLFEIPASQIARTRVLRTVLGGKTVFRLDQ